MDRPRLIAFFGPDGSGKTTQARLLASHLEQQGLKVRFVWIRYHHSLASILSQILARFGYYRIVSSGGKNYKLFNVKFLPQLKGFWGFIEFVSVLPWILIKVKLPSLLGYVVIADRYVVDTIVSVAYYLGGYKFLSKFYTKTLLSMVSDAFLIHLDAEIDDIVKRRKDEKLDLVFIRFQRKFYCSFANLLGSLNVDTSKTSILDTSNVIIKGYQKFK